MSEGGNTPLSEEEKKAGKLLAQKTEAQRQRRKSKKLRQKEKKKAAKAAAANKEDAQTAKTEEEKLEAKRAKNRRKKERQKQKKRDSKLALEATGGIAGDAEPVAPSTKTETKSLVGVPCSKYTLDKTGDFGACTCGHSKASHEKTKANKAEEALSKLKQKNSSKDMTVSTEKGECCANYRLDSSAKEFGACICGHPKANHGETKQNKAEAALEELKKNNSSKDMTVSTKEGECCANYRVDASAKEFGACVCGFPKKSHDEVQENKVEAALEKLKKKNEANKTVERRASQGGSQCGNYRVDPSATEFGTCLCGHSKAAHEEVQQNKAEAALEKLKKKNEVNKTVERRASQGGSQCGNYRVDPSATEFGTCLCGHSKAAHEEVQQNKAEAALEMLSNKNKGKNDKTKHERTKSGGACGNFRLDTVSTGAFGLW
jgi:hypothetical protein